MLRSAEPSYRGTRVAVLGATGFIGRWLARKLAAGGADVHLLARDRRRAAAVCTEYDIEATTWEVDLLDTRRLTAALLDVAPAITFNAAGYGVRRDERDPELARRINLDALPPLCEGLARVPSPWPGARLIHCGSAAEYGPATGVISEETPGAPDTIYGRSKLEATTWLARHCLRSGFRAMTARLFTVYGPGEPADRLLPSLCRALHTAQPVPLTDGRQQRDFTFVEDVADGLLRVGLRCPAPGAIVHVSTGVLTSVRTFAETAARILRVPVERLQFGAIPRHYEEMSPSGISVARLTSLLGWVPPTSVAEGIRRTLRFGRGDP